MNGYPIGWVEKNTGIGKETLRKWEERYGFPKPLRDEKGNRIYAQEEIGMIAEIGRLTNLGMRPSKAINAVLAGKVLGCRPKETSEFAEKVLATLSGSNSQSLQEVLQEELRLIGLANLVLERLPDLNESVGEHWAQGELSLYQEHLYCEVVQQVLRQAIHELVHPSAPQVTLLATPPGELHALGLLMVQAVLAIHGRKCISLGPQVPIAELSKATEKLSPLAIGLSFSSSYPKRKIGGFLAELRETIRPATEIWIGGSGAQCAGKLPAGIRLFSSISDFDSFIHGGLVPER